MHHTQELGALERKARLTTKCAQYSVRVVMSLVHQTWARECSKLGKDGKLTPQERERRIKAGLCLFCGQSGHMARDCPRSSSSASRARAAQLGSSDAPPSDEQPKE